ncbi:MAG: RDD family protein, partial [Stenotrophomonas sp.]
YLMAAFTERKHARPDMLCDTLVVDKWAFTENAEFQERGLGTVTIVILSLAGLGMLCLIGLFVLIGVAAAGFN